MTDTSLAHAIRAALAATTTDNDRIRLVRATIGEPMSDNTIIAQLTASADAEVVKAEETEEPK